MSESRNVFISRIDKTHIQRDEIYEFYKLCNEGRAISGISDKEFEKILKELDNDDIKYSNDMIIDMIIKDVSEYTNDIKLKEILEDINIANISDDTITGRAYPMYYDGSYYIELGRKIDDKVMILADIFAILFMYNENIDEIESLLLEELLEANIERFRNDEKSSDKFNTVQIKLLIFENLKGNGDFTDKYVAYSREIYEMAIAAIIGHEVGHHYFGHTSENIRNNEDAKIKEFNADCYGINFAIDYLQSAYANDKNSYGIHQFCGVYLPLIVSSYFCDNIFEDGERHPSILKRFYNLKEKMKKRIDISSHEEVIKYICKLVEIIKR